VNGTNVASSNLGSFTPNTVRDFLIGKRIDGGSGYLFSGQIDEPSVYSRALAPGEIKGIYVSGSEGKCSPEATNCLPPAAGLAAWWKADGSAADLVSGNVAKVSNTVTYASAKVGAGFVFDGTGFLEVPATSATDVGAGAGMTIECWAKPDSITAPMPLLEWKYTDTLGNAVGLQFWVNTYAQASLFASVTDTNGALHNISSPSGSIVTNRYQHLALTYDKATGLAKLYIDGAEVASQNVGNIRPKTWSNLLIGRRLDAGSGWKYRGGMDEISLYARALTPTEIQLIAAASGGGKCTPTDPPVTSCVAPATGLTAWWKADGSTLDVVGGNTAKVSNTVTYASAKVGAGFVFDGTGFLEVPASPAVNIGQGDGMTIECWIQPATTAAMPLLEWKYTDLLGNEVGSQFWVNVRGTGTLFASLTESNGAVHEVTSQAGTIVTSRYQHVALTYSKGSGIAKLYIDGAEAASSQVGVFSPKTWSNLLIGRRLDAGSGWKYRGGMDEISLYGRALSGAEIQSVYLAGSDGKCTTPTPPVIFVQPVGSTNDFGASTLLSVLASGTGPLSYQWRKNGTAINEATNSSLALDNLQLVNAGTYSVMVANGLGSVSSSNVIVSVFAPNCIPPAAGIVGWWKGEGNGSDEMGGGAGTLSEGVSYGLGKVGSGFVFQGGQGVVVVPASEVLDVGHYDGFTIEAWIKPSSSDLMPVMEWEWTAAGLETGIHLWINNHGTGTLFANLIDTNSAGHEIVSAPGIIIPNISQHVALTFVKATGTAKLFVNGVLVKTSEFGSLVPKANSNLLIGKRIANGVSYQGFSGTIDEPSVYARALGQGEIQAIVAASGAGKCAAPTSPVIVSQPVGSTNELGASTTISVLASGTGPLSYQWRKNGTAITGATNSSLGLANMTVADTGSYSAVVANSIGSVTSVVATVVVNASGLLVLPNYYKNADDGYNSGHLDEVNTRWQTIYGADQFPPQPIIIQEIRYRPSRVSGKAFSQMISNLQINLSTSTNSPNTLSTVFALNTGSDDTVVFQGDIALSSAFTSTPAGPKEFDIVIPLTTPFRFDPSKGNLLLDLRNPNGSTASRIDAGQFHTQSAARNFSRVPDVIAIAHDHNAEIIQIRYLAEPLEPTVPTILAQPVSSTNELGSSLALSVAAYGSSTLRYQWRFEGDAILGATNALLSLDNLQLTNAGAYSVVVSNTLGSVTSSNAFVSVVALPPYIVSQPANVSAVVGTTASFAVTAGGAKPLAYQWFLGGAGAVVGGTNATLTVTNVGPSVAGDYTVVVANSLGMATSSVVRLTVTYPPALISIGGTNAVSGRLVSLPVTIRANGNENALSFSLTYTPSRLLFVGAILGSGVEGGALLINDSQTNSGRVGLAMALPADTTFAAGTQQVLTVQFYVPFFATGSPVATSVGFTGTPVAQNLTDSSAASLLKSFSSAATVLLSPSPLEGDVYPRPNGSRTLDINDWVQVGRFVAGLDQASSGDEFQRIDSAPRETKGDGQLKVTDWVQAGRYAVGLDPVSSVGGPTSVVTQTSVSLSGRSGLAQNATRTLKAMNASGVHGLAVNIPVVLDAQGNENAVGFSLGFDTNAFTYVSSAKGSGFAAGSMQVNALQAGSGRVGVVLALPSGGKLPAGSVAVANITLQAKSPEAGNYSVSFVNGPSALGVSDAEANELVAVPMAASVAVNPAPTLTAVKAGETVKLSWPTWAEGFALQGGSLGGAGWTNVPAAAATNGGSVEVVLPLSGEPAFFRLQHP
jgi:hypothetical protein